jgi:tryptophan synthase alpha chain
MSGRIAKAFDKLRSTGGKGFVPFITAGDPDSETTLKLILSLSELGATVIELGVPFTDPMADGPVIQRSSQRALEKGGADIASILGIVTRARAQTEVPIVLFGYLNPFYSYGIERLREHSLEAGVDGLLITDIVEREFKQMSEKLAEDGLDLISLVAPTTSDERLKAIAGSARGFIYAVSRTGVTGEGAEMRFSAEELVKRIRSFSNLPVAVGFGIGSSAQVDDVLRYADAAVVGSAIVRVIEESGSSGATVTKVEEFVTILLGKEGSAIDSGRDLAVDRGECG